MPHPNGFAPIHPPADRLRGKPPCKVPFGLSTAVHGSPSAEVLRRQVIQGEHSVQGASGENNPPGARQSDDSVQRSRGGEHRVGVPSGENLASSAASEEGRDIQIVVLIGKDGLG